MVEEGYKKTEIGVIPVEWEVVKLGDFCDILDNKRVPLSSEQRATIKGNIPYYGANGVVDYINDFLFDEELVLLAEDGGNFSEYETRPIAYMIDGKSWVNNHTHILRAKNNQNHFLFYNLVHKNIMAFINGGTRAKLNRGELVKIKIPLPPLKEQEKIADILCSADDKIDAIVSQIEKAETLKKGLLQKLLSEGIGHSEFKDSELGKIPVGWEVVELGKVSKIKDGTHFSPKSKTGSFKYVTSKNIKFGYFDENKISYISEEEHNEIYKRCPVKKGQLLLTKDGAKTGNVCLNPLDEPFSLLSSVSVIDGKKDSLYNEYLLQWFLSELGQKRLKSSMAGQAITRLTLTKISAHKLIFPPLKEQKQIAEILSTSDEKLEVLRDKKQKYETLKKGLLQKLLSGEIRV